MSDITKKKSIKILGQPRSGGKYMRLVFQKIFPDKKIIHTHDRDVVNTDVVIVRDPRDSLASRLRLFSAMNDPITIKTKEDVDKWMNHMSARFILSVRNHCKHVCKNTKNKNLILLYYEKFVDNSEYITDMVSNKWGINISDEVVQDIKVNLTRDKTKQIIKNPGWGYSHVGDGEVGKWRNYIPEDLHDYFSRKNNLPNKILKDGEYFIV